MTLVLWWQVDADVRLLKSAVIKQMQTRRDPQVQVLSEQNTNLTFQLLYGATDKVSAALNRGTGLVFTLVHGVACRIKRSPASRASFSPVRQRARRSRS